MKKSTSHFDRVKFRIENKKGLGYSSNIARRIYAIIKGNEIMTQSSLASKLDVSDQYVSKILKGNQNLSLFTIAKISDALGVELITFPEYKYSKQYTVSKTVSHKEIENGKVVHMFNYLPYEKPFLIGAK
jgi:transcriptional regulator with XRE-family HTH domain